VNVRRGIGAAAAVIILGVKFFKAHIYQRQIGIRFAICFGISINRIASLEILEIDQYFIFGIDSVPRYSCTPSSSICSRVALLRIVGHGWALDDEQKQNK
jgi:hypothetical protein